jgi:exosome complex component RRP41
MVPAISVGRVGDKLVIDLDGDEEHFSDNESADIPVAMLPLTGEVSLLQMDGRITQAQLEEGFDLVKEPLNRIRKVMIQAVKDKYAEDDNE